MENVLPNNTNLILEIFDRLTKEVIKSDARTVLSVRTISEDLTVELIHYNDYYEHNNRTLTFYPFLSEEKLREQERIAIDVLHNDGLIEREANL